MEANYDSCMLQTGPYTRELKARIASDSGHLSNETTAEFLSTHYTPRLKYVWLCHISKDKAHTAYQDSITYVVRTIVWDGEWFYDKVMYTNRGMNLKYPAVYFPSFEYLALADAFVCQRGSISRDVVFLFARKTSDWFYMICMVVRNEYAKYIGQVDIFVFKHFLGGSMSNTGIN